MHPSKQLADPFIASREVEASSLRGIRGIRHAVLPFFAISGLRGADAAL
jgi:hypothetical protein